MSRDRRLQVRYSEEEEASWKRHAGRRELSAFVRNTMNEAVAARELVARASGQWREPVPVGSDDGPGPGDPAWDAAAREYGRAVGQGQSGPTAVPAEPPRREARGFSKADQVGRARPPGADPPREAPGGLGGQRRAVEPPAAARVSSGRPIPAEPGTCQHKLWDCRICRTGRWA